MNNTQPGGALLPELSDDRVDAIEMQLFERINGERNGGTQKRSSRRRSAWIVSGAAATIIVVAAVVAPAISSSLGSSGASDSAFAPASSAPDFGAVQSESATEGGLGGSEAAFGQVELADSDAFARDIIASASASLRASDVPEAIAAIKVAAEARGGYVESQDVSEAGLPGYGSTGPGGWITVRVPSAQLDQMITELSEFGEVLSTNTSAFDVTSQTVDLRARLTAAEASVERLLDLLSQAATTADLLAAESALAERQATVESYTQQLAMLEDQVAMSSLNVSVVSPGEAVKAEPAGFGDGLAAGWNGLIATLNGIVIALGFLLPWLAILGIAAVIIWAIVRARRTRRAARAAAARDAARAASDSASQG